MEYFLSEVSLHGFCRFSQKLKRRGETVIIFEKHNWIAIKDYMSHCVIKKVSVTIVSIPYGYRDTEL